MADNNEPTLRNALDAVNRSRKWAMLAIGSLSVAVALVLFILTMAVAIPSSQQGVAVDLPTGEPIIAVNRLMPMKVLWLTLAVQLFFVACGTITVVVHVSRMTRSILRAIESVKR